MNLVMMTPGTNRTTGCQHRQPHRRDRWSGSVKTPPVQQRPAEQGWKGSVTCTHSRWVYWLMALLKVSSFRELGMRLFVILNLSTDKLLILALRKNPIQVALLLKFILMCQFCALFILLFFCHNVPVQVKHILGIAPQDKGNLDVLPNAKCSILKRI